MAVIEATTLRPHVSTRPLDAPRPDLASEQERDRILAEDGPQQVLLVASSGGHLAQLMAMKPWWANRERSWATFRTDDVVSQLDGEQVDFVHHPTTRNVPNMLRNFGVAWRVLRRRRPDLIVSTGAGSAIPFFLFAKVLGINSVYVEVYDRISTRTVTGRVCRPLATRFFVQWDAQVELYPGSRVIGPLL